MRTEHGPRAVAVVLAALALMATPGFAAESGAAAGAEEAPQPGANWQHWHANSDVTDLASVQRGARNFMSYCLGCHSLKYERWSRLGADLAIPPALLQNLMPPGDKSTDYILSTMPAEDAANWFGKTPPDLSLMARARGGGDYIYQLFKTFYVDPTRQTGVNNLRLPAIAMPHVLSELEGLKRAVFKDVAKTESGQLVHTQVFDHFETVTPGRLTAAEYDGFVRDTVNFLVYVGEPTQAARHALGVWVVLFLLVFTWLAWLMKRDYWKDVH